MLLAKVNSLSEYIVSQSVRHQIMCPLTAYVCVGRALGDAELQKFVSEDSLRMVVPQDRMVMVSKPGKHGAAKMVPMSSLSSSQKAMYAPTLPQQRAKLVQLR
jgi:hypothetical protein